MLEYLIAGGPVMVPIGICSVIAMAAFLERLWTLRRQRVVPPALMRQLIETTRKGEYDAARALARKHDVPVARLIQAAIEVRGQPRSVVKERLEEVGRREAAEMERVIPVLGTIASIAPLLGLLGTVGGMIVTFEIIQHQGLGNMDSLAGGISQALVTTFAGLTVGIPAVVGNRYLLARVDNLLLSLEEASLGVLDVVSGDEHLEETA